MKRARGLERAAVPRRRQNRRRAEGPRAAAAPIHKERAGATRAQIAEAALDLFVSQGFAETTIDQIATAARVGRRTIFRHFATKEAILFDHLVVRRETAVQLLQQRPPDEPGNLLGPAAEPPLDRFTVAAGVRRPGQHRVLGGHPAEAAAPPPARHLFGDARRAQHPGRAEFHEHRPLGVLQPAPGKPHRAQRVRGPSIWS